MGGHGFIGPNMCYVGRGPCSRDATCRGLLVGNMNSPTKSTLCFHRQYWVTVAVPFLSAAGRERHVTVGACSAMEMMPLWCCTLLEKKHEICINLIQTLYVPKILLLFIDSDSEININLHSFMSSRNESFTLNLWNI